MADDAFDRGLVRLTEAGPDLDNGLSNHAPMVIEALNALDCDVAIAGWIDRYLPGTRPWPARKAPIAELASGPLGHADRATDWRELFCLQLERTPWRSVLRSAVEQLAPGAVSDATHGLIRVGHAVRSLAAAATPARQHELACALAVWASTYQTLGNASGESRCLPALAAARHLPRLPASQRRQHGTIVAALAPLRDFPPFEAVCGLIDRNETPASVAAVCARLYLANARDTLTTIVFVHGVTSMTAIDHLWPHLEPASQAQLLVYGWQAVAGLYAAYGTKPPTAADATFSASPSELVAAAIRHGDEHAIKMVEACLHHYRRQPDAVFLAAAQHALGMLPARR